MNNEHNDATVTSVASSAASVQLLAIRRDRLGAVIFNDSTQTLYVRFGADDAATNDYTYEVLTRGTLEVPYQYNGRIAGIWAAANGQARITEVF